MRGFTLLELLIVMGSILVLGALTLPVGFRFFQAQSLDESASNILVALRRAQSQAYFQKHDDSFGVKFLSNSYVLFRGTTYAARVQSEDEVFILPVNTSSTGLDEVIFAKLTGIPNVSGMITVTSGGDSERIVINANGIIEFQ